MFQLTAAGFFPGEQVQATVGFPGGLSTALFVADTNGSVFSAITVGQTDPVGTYTISLRGAMSGGQGIAFFTVSAAPTAIPTAPPAPTAVPPTATPTEGYSVLTAGNYVFVEQKSVLENTPTCSLSGWGLDCSKRVKDVATVIQRLGPFPTASQARTAYCGAMVQGSAHYIAIAFGTKAKFTFDPNTEYWIDNAPSC